MSLIVQSAPLGFQWPTLDPFLFCVHHDDAYPAGNEQLGPAASLAGRDVGQDFAGIDGWRMYHGEVVPGFPQHPHRGFETVTVARRGLIDHCDSLGASARFGRGDVQWLTAGAGIVHSEMFPLLERAAPNPVELFQIWLNLAAVDKMAEPHFSMLWAERVPRVMVTSESGKNAEITVIAGPLLGASPPAPPPRSWASRPDAEVTIACLRLEEGAVCTLPPTARRETIRTLYFFAGGALRVGEQLVASHAALVVRSDQPLRIESIEGQCELLLLQGRPIGEPVVQHGPFVMNTRGEIERAMTDYQRTRFGGWSWPSGAPVHGREPGRFARRPGGVIERP